MRISVLGRDTAALEGRLLAARAAASGVVARNALSDCEPFVPFDSGALRRSGTPVEHADGSATVEWGTDADTAAYARKQYYGNYRHDTVQNGLNAPKAQGHWFDGARAERLAEWERMYRTVYGGAIHG